MVSKTKNLTSLPTQKRVPALPKENPPFTKKDLRKSIPPHLLKRSYFKSFYHLLSDLICIIGALFAYVAFDTFFPNAHWTVQFLVFLSYAIYNGINGTGLWVLCHECGHGAFTDSKIVNDVVGSIFHSMLCVPYFAWAYSHAKHHARCNHMEEDEPYIPVRESSLKDYNSERPKARPSGFIGTFINSFIILVLGWPLYLTFNLSGPGPSKGSYPNHFIPGNKMWGKLAHWKFYLNNVMLLSWQIVLYSLAQKYGWSAILRYFWAPQIVVNAFLTSITFLQHTDPRIAHFEASQWTWLRGALSTVDRTMGPWLDAKLHHIVDSHVMHHVFSDIPFYNCKEITKIISPKLGPYYCRIQSNFFIDFWKNVQNCQTVHGKGGVLHFVTDNF